MSFLFGGWKENLVGLVETDPISLHVQTMEQYRRKLHAVNNEFLSSPNSFDFVFQRQIRAQQNLHEAYEEKKKKAPKVRIL